VFLALYCFFTSCSLSSCPGSSGVSKFTEWLMVIMMIMISCNVDIICFFFTYLYPIHTQTRRAKATVIKNWVVKLVVILDILYYYQAILCRKTFSSSRKVEFVCQKLGQLDRNELKKKMKYLIRIKRLY